MGALRAPRRSTRGVIATPDNCAYMSLSTASPLIDICVVMAGPSISSIFRLARVVRAKEIVYELVVATRVDRRVKELTAIFAYPH